jgi:hypothetical protein
MADPFQKPQSHGQKGYSSADVIALQVLAWVIGDDNRSQRLLDMTGLSVDDLRERAGSSEVLSAVMGWLASHEPDVLAASDDLKIPPEYLARAIYELDG